MRERNVRLFTVSRMMKTISWVREEDARIPVLTLIGKS